MKDAAKKANPTCNQSLNKFSATTLSLMNRRNDLIIRNSEDLLVTTDHNSVIFIERVTSLSEDTDSKQIRSLAHGLPDSKVIWPDWPGLVFPLASRIRFATLGPSTIRMLSASLTKVYYSFSHWQAVFRFATLGPSTILMLPASVPDSGHIRKTGSGTSIGPVCKSGPAQTWLPDSGRIIGLGGLVWAGYFLLSGIITGPCANCAK
ncbi:hypothetical protein GQR58_009248 [Nymphon striatum]|nr:hypothetical protein GQR58_009248 [Nymphon striatum]